MKNPPDIILLESVNAIDRHGMNFLPIGTKGILLSKGKNTSTIKIGTETYNLPNTSFLEVVKGKAA